MGNVTKCVVRPKERRKAGARLHQVDKLPIRMKKKDESLEMHHIHAMRIAASPMIAHIESRHVKYDTYVRSYRDTYQ